MFGAQSSDQVLRIWKKKKRDHIITFFNQRYEYWIVSYSLHFRDSLNFKIQRIKKPTDLSASLKRPSTIHGTFPKGLIAAHCQNELHHKKASLHKKLFMTRKVSNPCKIPKLTKALHYNQRILMNKNLCSPTQNQGGKNH